MRYTVVLNGCSRNFLSQAEELNGFLADNALNSLKVNTIIFYVDDEKKSALIAHAPSSCIRLVKVARYQPEPILEILKQLENNEGTGVYLFPSDFTGSELAVRLAYRMAGSSLVAVNRIEIKGEKLTCYKAVYASYMRGEFVLQKPPYCISIAKGCVVRQPVLKRREHDLTEVDGMKMAKGNFTRAYEFIEEEAASGIEDAKFLVVAGRGVKSAEKVEKIKGVAKIIGAELGVSRPIAMSALAPLNHLVGVSGVMTKPQLCITAGVSGAAAFFAGIEKSKYIIAINTDKNAPIVQASDVAIIDDYERVLDELVKIIGRSV
jgi:electron transfer flavoprotein alpha subunit